MEKRAYCPVGILCGTRGMVEGGGAGEGGGRKTGNSAFARPYRPKADRARAGKNALCDVDQNWQFARGCGRSPRLILEFSELLERGESVRACPVCLSTFDDAVRFCPFHGVELKVLPENTVSVGESLNGYYLKEKIGEDGLGAVYRAEKGGNTYRLRCFSEAVLCDSGRSSRLNDVLELSMSLSGGAIPVADYGWNESGILYSAHPYIPGRSFRDVLKLGIALSEQDVAQMLLQLLRAVRDIHGQHVTHGNISLSNIIIDSSGRIRLHDAGFLGIFRDGHFEELRDDNPGVFGDVLDLMSPEVGRGEAACVYSDVYSCGASACCLMSGVSGPGDLAARMEAHLDGSIQEFWLRNLRRPVSQDFCDLLEASTLGSSSVRFQTARAFITALVSIHPELDESGDALSGGLVERLLDGAERVSAVDRRAVSRQTVLSGFDEAFDTIHEAASRESTRRGYDAERTVVEKTRFDGLTDIVGEALVETEIARQLERAVTTEMDPVEASPTVEFSEPAFAIRGEEAKSLDEEISSILNLAESLSKPEMTLEVGDALSSADTESEEHSESEVKDVESEDHSESEAKDVESEDKSESEDQSESEDKSESGTATELAECSKSEALRKAEAAERAFKEECARQAEERESDKGSKPHKRIGKRKDKSRASELERGDVVSMSSVEMKRVKRRRRDLADCAPRNEVVTAELEIPAMVDPSKMPEYSNLPGMTATHGFVYDEGETEEAMGSEASVDVELEQGGVQEVPETPEVSEVPPEEDGGDEEGWFGDDAPEVSQKRGRKSIKFFIAMAAVLAIACSVVAVNKCSMPSDSSTSAEQTAPDARLAEFEQVLGQSTAESRARALALFDELREANLSGGEIKKCREMLLASLNRQADELKKGLKNVEDIPDPLDMSATSDALSKDYLDCVTGVREDSPERDKLMGACESARKDALQASLAQGIASSRALLPQYESLRDGWEEVEGIYASIQKYARGDSRSADGVLLDEASAQKAGFASRIEAVHGHDDVTVPSEPSASDAPSGVAPDDSGSDRQESPGVVENAPVVEAPAAPDDSGADRQESPGVVENVPVVEAPVAPVETPKPVEPAPVAQKPVVSPKPAEPVVSPKPAEPAPVAQKSVAQKPVETPKPVEPAPKAAETSKRIVLVDEEEPSKTTSKPSKPSTPAPASAQGNVPTAKLIADAQAAMSRKDFEGAVRLLEKATAQDKSNARAWLSLAKANERLGKLVLAATEAETSCKLSKTASCYVYLGDLYGKAGMTDESRGAYEKALQIDPNNAAASAKLR